MRIRLNAQHQPIPAYRSLRVRRSRAMLWNLTALGADAVLVRPGV